MEIPFFRVEGFFEVGPLLIDYPSLPWQPFRSPFGVSVSFFRSHLKFLQKEFYFPSFLQFVAA